MAEATVPETWIGQRVGVIVTETAEPFRGPLLEVNDRGIVIDSHLDPEQLGEGMPELKEASRGESLSIPSFFPWSSVKMLHRML